MELVVCRSASTLFYQQHPIMTEFDEHFSEPLSDSQLVEGRGGETGHRSHKCGPYPCWYRKHTRNNTLRGPLQARKSENVTNIYNRMHLNIEKCDQ